MDTNRPLVISVRLDWRVVLVVGVVLGMLLAARGIPAGASTVGAAPAAAAAAGAAAGAGARRSYYLTEFYAYPNAVLTACDVGYHTASLWEIYDVSNLAYAGSHPDAYAEADSGDGPPTQYGGWVRTGFASNFVSLAGRANCRVWTSVAASDYGSYVRLSDSWDGTSADLGPWIVSATECDTLGRVWCVED